MKPEHLVLLALGVGRAKDHQRIREFLEEKAVNPKTLKAAIDVTNCNRPGAGSAQKLESATHLVQNRSMKKRPKAPVPFTLESALAMKESARKVRRNLSFGEKIERMEALRERLRPLKEAREARRKKTGSTAIGK